MGDYVSLTDVKELLVDLQGDTTYDAFLNKAITRSSKDVDWLTGSFFDKATATKTWDGSGTQTLFLPWAWPISVVTTLKVRAGGEGTAQVTVASSDYFLEPAGRMAGAPARWIELATRPTSGVTVFTAGKGTVEIAGDYGWTTTSDDIKEVTLELVIGSWRNRGKGGHIPATGVDPDLEPILRSLSPRSIAILKQHGYKRPQLG